ncbi:hypothetical protein SUDANB108_04099 [Streptomyces sp. enrichment culture]|uniref:hypothetical protein n=1 Tax=Streptomyces sp. enrichment culture TaxID=1795815 RepID=UPI003F560347
MPIGESDFDDQHGPRDHVCGPASAVWLPTGLGHEDQPARFPVTFASGTAAGVRGRRSFRGRNRTDIEPDLPGWPKRANAFAVRRVPGRIGVHVGSAALGLLRLLRGILSELLGGGTVDYEPARGKVEDRANEVDDFPVIWAGPDDAARTLPWQLDPARRPPGEVTELVITKHRLLIINSGETLWETSRHNLATAEIKPFSLGRRDLRISFQDGSWTRLTTLRSTQTARLVKLLHG